MYTEGLSPQVQNDIEDAPVGVGGIGRRKRSRGDEGWMTDVAKQIEKDEKSYANETRYPAGASNAVPNYLNNATLDTAYMKAVGDSEIIIVGFLVADFVSVALFL